MAERSINLNLKSISLDGLWGVGLQSILTSDGSPAIRVSVGRPADRTLFGQRVSDEQAARRSRNIDEHR